MYPTPAARAAPGGPRSETDLPSLADLVAQLRGLGAGRVSDTFILPVPQGRAARRRRSTVTAWISYRGRRQECFLRAAQVPFDLLPFRSADEARRGAWFSVGPGVGPDPTRPGVHPAVVQVQVEGAPQQVADWARVIADRLEASRVAAVRCVVEDAPDWHRLCLAGVLGHAAPDDFVLERMG